MTAACNTPAHHFPEEMLLDYTAGSLPEGLSILVATHLSLCPACRAVVADCEAVGGELLSGLAPVALASDALDKVLARLDAEEARAGADVLAGPAAAQRPLPAPLCDYLGDDPDELAWQALAPGIELVALPPKGGDAWPGTSGVSLVRMDPGTVAPRHTHAGIEATVIVRGGFADELGQYEEGDAWIVDASVTHAPVALPGEPCLCLVYLEAPLKPVGDRHVASI